MAVQRTVPVPYIAMAARSAVRVQLYGNSRYQYSGPVQLYKLYLVLSTIYLYRTLPPFRNGRSTLSERGVWAMACCTHKIYVILASMGRAARLQVHGGRT